MIYSVTAENYLGESITMDLKEPEKSGFIIKEITGLGPGKADINTTNLATGDGSLYNSARMQERNIVLHLIFLATNIETQRQLSYKYFPIKKKIILRFETDNRKAYITGYVESNEPDIFNNKYEQTQISIVCPDPYFYADITDGSDTTVFSGTEPMFNFLVDDDQNPIPELPGSEYSTFENPSLTEPMIEFGVIKIKSEETVYYTGDSNVGVLINIHALGNVDMINIYNVNTREKMSIDTTKIESMTGSGIIAGDDIIINTVRNNKSIQLRRNGELINILNCLNKDADWFTLSKGDNIFSFTADYGANNLQFKITNSILYEGI